MKKMIMSAVLAAVVVMMTGCAMVPGTIIDKSKPMEQNKYTVVGDEVSATECVVYIFGIALSDLRGSAGRRMYKSCLNQAAGADALIEYTTDTKYLNLGPVGVMWYTLTGIPVKTDK